MIGFLASAVTGANEILPPTRMATSSFMIGLKLNKSAGGSHGLSFLQTLHLYWIIALLGQDRNFSFGNLKIFLTDSFTHVSRMPWILFPLYATLYSIKELE